jgi:DNA polymerase-3 subunit gamma/tau
MSKALYRKYRSKTLDEVIGQRHVTDILANAIKNGRISHAYLLTGPRGVGKTSVARILAHEINGLVYDESATNLDIIEIDAASNNGVEDVRDLREKVQIAPVSAKKKVYIIDEVHMLSKAAFNALLKTLEEPPEHVVFILATTNVEKIPATIISRTQRFSFRPITVEDATKHLADIARQENIKITDEALKLIALRSDGSFRDSISLLDQLSSLADIDDTKTITAQLIEDTLGLTSLDTINQIIEAVETKNLAKVVEILTITLNNGVSTSVLVSQLTTIISDQIAAKPNLLPLLDALIDVTKSPQPQLKLLSVLGIAASPKPAPKTVALATPVYEVTASITELEKQSKKEFSKAPADNRVAVNSTAFVGGNLQSKSEQASNDERVALGRAAPDSADTKGGRKSGSDRAAVPVKKFEADKFDWAKLVEYTRQNYIALYSVLSKCGYELEGDVLTLYTGNNFYKKKLDDTKYCPLLAKCLQEVGVFGLNVHTLPTTLPPKDSQAAAIAAMMGGGEEVSLEAA